jgi:putative inorganic carbon (hco3(-)) transporter
VSISYRLSAIGYPATKPAFWLAGMALGLAIFYRGSYQLPISALGLAIFGLLTLRRPELGLLFVPLSAPLHFMPKGIWDERFGIRPEGIRFPLHEVILLIVLGATIVHIGSGLIRRMQQKTKQPAIGYRLSTIGYRFAPVALFFVAGNAGLLLADAAGRSEALREWRWLIVEPLIFYGLLVYLYGGSDAKHRQLWPLAALLLGGALVGLIGVLQFFGLNLAPLIGDKPGFSNDQVFVQGVQRVSSVYGHPNNLGLYSGRIWPLGLGLALAAWLAWLPRPWRWLGGAAAVLGLGGLLVSFSRGAWLSALGAALLLAWLLLPAGRAARLRLITTTAVLLVSLLTLGLLAMAAGIERLNPLGETGIIRLYTWQSALAMLRDYPWGIGLDQFGRLYPEYVNPSLADSNERFTSHPHNLFLDLLLRLGPLGLLSFGWLIWRYYRKLWPLPAHNDARRYLAAGLAAAMPATLLHGLVDNWYFVPDLAFGFWLLYWQAEEL